MSKWQYFLNSLATPGGNLLLLVFFGLMFIVMVFFMCYGRQEKDVQLMTFVLSTASAFSGALLQALRGRSTDAQASPPGTSTQTSQIVTPPAPPAA